MLLNPCNIMGQVPLLEILVPQFKQPCLLVHFIHRWWAWAVVAILVVMGRKLRKVGARPASVAVHSAFGTQVLLGIATVYRNIRSLTEEGELSEVKLPGENPRFELAGHQHHHHFQ